MMCVEGEGSDKIKKCDIYIYSRAERMANN